MYIPIQAYNFPWKLPLDCYDTCDNNLSGDRAQFQKNWKGVAGRILINTSTSNFLDFARMSLHLML